MWKNKNSLVAKFGCECYFERDLSFVSHKISNLQTAWPVLSEKVRWGVKKPPPPLAAAANAHRKNNNFYGNSPED